MPRVTETYRLERREQIQDAAARCFARQGFHATSMDDVIAEAGLSAGAVYGHFRAKDELIEAVAGRAMELVGEVLGEVAEAVTPAAMLDGVLSLMGKLSERYGFDPTAVAIQAWGESLRSPAVLARVSEAYRLIRTQMAGAVRRWQQAGLVAADADPDEVAKVLFGLIPGYIVQRQLLGDVRPDRYAAALAGLSPG